MLAKYRSLSQTDVEAGVIGQNRIFVSSSISDQNQICFKLPLCNNTHEQGIVRLNH